MTGPGENNKHIPLVNSEKTLGKRCSGRKNPFDVYEFIKSAALSDIREMVSRYSGVVSERERRTRKISLTSEKKWRDSRGNDFLAMDRIIDCVLEALCPFVVLVCSSRDPDCKYRETSRE